MASRTEFNDSFQRAFFTAEIQKLSYEQKGTELHKNVVNKDEYQVFYTLTNIPFLARCDFLKILDENKESALHLAADRKMIKLIYKILRLVPRDQRKDLLNFKDCADNSVMETIALNISDENQEYLIKIFRIFMKGENSDFLENHSVGNILSGHLNKELVKKIKTFSAVKKITIEESAKSNKVPAFCKLV